jgi:hypothetical protein
MSKTHSTQKYLDDLTEKLNTLIEKIENSIPFVLKELKLSFTNMPGDIRQLHNDVRNMLNHVHKEINITLTNVTNNSEVSYVAVTMENLHKDIDHIEVELVKISNKYVDNSLLQAAIEHFYTLNTAVKKMIAAIVNASSNIIKKLDLVEEGKFKNHMLGSKVHERKLVKSLGNKNKERKLVRKAKI